MIASLPTPHRLGLRACLPAIILVAAGAMAPTAGALADTATYPTLEQAIATTCAETADAVNAPPEDCGAITTAVIGEANDTTLHFARYCLDDTVKHVGEFCILQGMAVFAQAQSGQTTRLFETNSDMSETFQPPGLLDTPYGKVLDIEDTLAGTGNYNESTYLLLKDRQWEQIDSSSWLNDLQARIPNGTEIHKGVWPDLVTMNAQAYLYKPEDANCCPTAGTANIELELIGTRLAIKSLTVGPAPEK